MATTAINSDNDSGNATRNVTMQVEPPPPLSEDRSGVDLARRRLFKGKRLDFGIPPFTYFKARRTGDNSKSPPLVEQSTLSDEAAEIDLNDTCVDLDTSQDVYRWAVVYENQRGCADASFDSSKAYVLHSFLRVTIFSTPYYSRLGLLPNDPPPFTVPEADGRRDIQPQVSLHDYPLPDGTWRWVSKSWMVDMRSEGEVHYDGFEYNWVFRRHKWRPEPGTFSAGAWVRRRRWIRLMMRPAHPLAIEQHDDSDGQRPRTVSTPMTRYSIVPDDSVPELETEKTMVWRGDLDDWKRCHHLMTRLNRDGIKLELWRDWLGVSPRTRRRVWTEDESFNPSEGFNDGPMVRAPALEGAQRDSLVTAVQEHVRAVSIPDFCRSDDLRLRICYSNSYTPNLVYSCWRFYVLEVSWCAEICLKILVFNFGVTHEGKQFEIRVLSHVIVVLPYF
jgi:hypothetical protein